MRRVLLSFIFLFLFGMGSPALATVTVTPVPSPATAGQSVTVNISSEFIAGAIPPCNVTVNFGDGSPVAITTTSPASCPVSGPFVNCNTSATHTYATPGTYTITADDSACAAFNPTAPTTGNASLTVNAACAPLSITTASLAAATAGQPYTAQLNTAGGSGSLSFGILAGSLPPGLSLSATGLISGTPTSSGNFSFTPRVTDSCSAGAQTASTPLTMAVLCPALTITTPTLPSATTGQPYSAQVTTAGGSGAVSFSLLTGSLPAGLTLSSAGLISGVPTAVGNFPLTVGATDTCPLGAQTANRALTIASALPASAVSASVSPTLLAVPAGGPSNRSLTYTIQSATPVSLSSAAGTFTAGSAVLGSVTTPLAVTVNGRATATEALFIPAAILEKALQTGSNRITYTRTFVNTTLGISTSVAATVAITGESAADFSIRRMELSFDRHGAVQKTVPWRETGLKARAEFRFVGTGTLQGYWEVDGRIISQVVQQLVPGANLIIETPAIPPLPTFDPGSHVVRFVVQSPAVTFELPAIVYTVLPQADSAVLEQLVLSQPADRAMLDFEPPKFQWQRLSTQGTYQIRFFRESGEPFFSAFTGETTYTVPRSVFRSLFAPGKSYRWQVQLIRNDKPVSESIQWGFRFKPLRAHLPDQVIITVREGSGTNDTVLAQKYGLRVIEIFPLPSIGLIGILAQTEKDADVVSLARKLQNEPGVVTAQPNFLLMLQGEAVGKIRHSGDGLHLDRLHKSLTGRNVRIAVIDTGVDDRHRHLKNRVSRTVNFVRGETYRGEIHGTAVAGIIAAARDASGMEGVAPEAELLALRACRQSRGDTPEGECSSDSLAKALNEAVVQRADLVNMSFGKGDYDPLLARILEAGMAKGIVFVAPVGNDPTDSVLFPASYPGVISVAGLDEKGKPSGSPGVNGKATVSAPAAGIFTTVPGDRHNFLSGTSFSSAYITGLLALAKEKSGTLNRQKIPKWHGDLCLWEEELLKVSLCKK